jgi:hypothetical protein
MTMTFNDKLTGAKLAGYCLQAMPVLKHLEATDTTITYKDFGVRIGPIGPDGWQPWHRRHIGMILYACAALDDYADTHEVASALTRVVSAEGEAGAGAHKWRRSSLAARRPKPKNLSGNSHQSTGS